VAGRDGAGREAAVRQHTAEDLARAIQKKYPTREVGYLPRRSDTREAIQRIMQAHGWKSAVLVMMGAGDIVAESDAWFAPHRTFAVQ